MADVMRGRPDSLAIRASGAGTRTPPTPPQAAPPAPRRAGPERVKVYLDRRGGLVPPVEGYLPELAANGASAWQIKEIQRYLAHATRQIDQADRRLLKDETIPQQERVVSNFEPHTRNISKGRAGRPVELGVPVCAIEDGHGFILHHEMMWRGSDVEYAVPMIRGAVPRPPRGEFRRRLPQPGEPGPARRSARLQCPAEEGLPEPGGARARKRGGLRRDAQAASGVESATDNSRHRGLDRVLAHGAGGFDRTVALSVVALNVHRIGLLLRRKARKRSRRAA